MSHNLSIFSLTALILSSKEAAAGNPGRVASNLCRFLYPRSTVYKQDVSSCFAKSNICAEVKCLTPNIPIRHIDLLYEFSNHFSGFQVYAHAYLRDVVTTPLVNE